MTAPHPDLDPRGYDAWVNEQEAAADEHRGRELGEHFAELIYGWVREEVPDEPF